MLRGRLGVVAAGAIACVMLGACTTTPTSDPLDVAAIPVSQPAQQRAYERRNTQASTDDVQPPAEPDEVWLRIRRALTMAGATRPEVIKQLGWFKRNPDYMQRVSQRAEPYLYFIVEELERRQLPLDLALLPIIESAYQPTAYSRGRAAGLWQFVAATGRRYGLHQDWWFDERREVVSASRAAMDYLSALHAKFGGNWLHALAAYNCGENKVARSIRRNRDNGKPTDFWSLKLPTETRAYVPKLLAVATIVADPAGHGITLTAIPNRRYFQTVDLGAQTDLAEATRLAGISEAEFKALNPAFRRGVTPPEGPHSVLVPVAKADQLSAGIALLTPEQRLPWPLHRVSPGDTLSDIALKYGSSVAALQRVNRLRGSLIRAGQTLVVPRGVKGPTVASPRVLSRNGTHYTVRSGDSLWAIARHLKIKLRDLRAWNGLDTQAVLQPGQRLVISTDTGANVKATPTTLRHYCVRPGDSLWRIARRFNLSVEDLQTWNRLPDNALLQPGQRIHLQPQETSASAG